MSACQCGRSDCSLGNALDAELLSEFLRALPEPAALTSAFETACGRLPQPLDRAEHARPWLSADGELAEGVLPRGHVLDMLGLQDELRQPLAEPSAKPAAPVACQDRRGRAFLACQQAA